MNLIVRSAMKKIKWAKQIEDSGCGAILNKTEGSKGLSDGEAVGLGQHCRPRAPQARVPQRVELTAFGGQPEGRPGGRRGAMAASGRVKYDRKPLEGLKRYLF